MNHLTLRFAGDIPFLRYIVPFAYSDKGDKYKETVERIANSKEWTVLKRSELVPSHEEDLYDYIYSSFIDADWDVTGGGTKDNNIGVGFVPVDFKRKGLFYHHYKKVEGKTEQSEDGFVECATSFTIVGEGLFLFRTGVGFYWYDVKVPEMSADDLVLFQNRFKELNVIRYAKKKRDKFWFGPKKNGTGDDRFTMGNHIANRLTGIFDSVSYFPARVNAILREKKQRENRDSWKEFLKTGNTLSEEGLPFEKTEEYAARLKHYNEEKTLWDNMTISQIGEGVREGYQTIVPDRAILFSYVVFHSEQDADGEEEKQGLISDMCKYAYHISRGYKESYKVTKGAMEERKYMFFRHENDIWEASLEGIGCFVSIYEEVYDKNGDLRSNSFYDTYRVKEMKGDYFLLYLLLLYQHYTLLYYFQKLSRNFSFNPEHYLEYREGLYEKLHAFKVESDVFLSGNIYEAVSHTTDICNLFTFIEEKMRIHKDYENLKKCIVNLENLQQDILEKKKEKEAEEEEKRKEDVNKAIGIASGIVGAFALFSVVNDVVSLTKMIQNFFGLGEADYILLLCALQGSVVVGTIVAAVILVRCFFKKRRKKKE